MRTQVMAFIVGPPGAGKTTVARIACAQLRALLNRPVIHVEVDDVRWMIIDGDDDCPSPLWLELTEALIDKAAARAAAIVVEGLFYNPAHLEHLLRRYETAQTFVLEASLEVCLMRNRARAPVAECLPDEEVERLHVLERPAAWTRLNGEDDDADVVAARLVNQLLRQSNGLVGFST
jgi:adenylate kinase family enzyme